jgi:hypothetical protein
MVEPETELEMAERHVRAMEAGVSRQAALIVRMNADASEHLELACLMLATMRRSLSAAIDYRDRLAAWNSNR